jgi:hypothetical protein
VSALGGFLDKYTKFFRHRNEAHGPEFHNPPPVNIPPPTVTFADRLRWWSWDRRERRRKIRQERDRRLQDILVVKQHPASKRQT